jgi:hypothetical protein
MRFWLQQIKKLNADEIEKRFPMRDVHLPVEELLSLTGEEVSAKEQLLSEEE